MKKSTILILCALLLGLLCIPLIAACTPRDQVLRIYTCEDYLSYSKVDADVHLDKEFEEYYRQVTGKKVKVKVETFLDNESMYAKIAAGKADYDIAVPSDYMIEKMRKNNLLIPLSENLGNDVNGNPIKDYRGNIAPFAEQFARENYDPEYKYSRVYMWGTLGVLFNKTMIKNTDDADGNGYPDFVQSWDCIYNNSDPYYNDSITIKNSIRDSVATAAIQTSKASFTDANGKFDPAKKSVLRSVLNATDDASVAAIKNTLINATVTNAATFKGFDDEEAKQWSIDGDLKLALQWQGDAFGCIMENNNLDYYVPDEGSNIFFDGWVIPAHAKNQEAAQLWINFMCKPSSAIANMEYIGYTSAVSSPEILAWCNETYADLPAIDRSYFFGAEATAVHADPRQYLPASVVARCEMMQDYGTDAEKKILDMWNEVRGTN